MDFANIKLVKKELHAVISLNRPKSMNAINNGLLTDV